VTCRYSIIHTNNWHSPLFVGVQVSKDSETILQPCEKGRTLVRGACETLPPGSSIIAAQECDLIHHRGLCNCAVGIGSAGGGSGSKVTNSHERDNGPATGIFEFIPECAVGRLSRIWSRRQNAFIHGMVHVLPKGSSCATIYMLRSGSRLLIGIPLHAHIYPWLSFHDLRIIPYD